MINVDLFDIHNIQGVYYCIMTDEQITLKEAEALRHIRNQLMHHGKVPSLRELMVAMRYKSPRSTALIIGGLIKKGLLKKQRDGRVQLVEDLESRPCNARTVKIPLVGAVACGLPIIAEQNVEAMISVSTSLVRAGSRYFLLRARGDSMDRQDINDGDLVLVRLQSVASDGDIVVALIDDEATVKEFRQTRDTIVLRPKSSNKNHQPIILTNEFMVQGVVVATIPSLEQREE